MLLDFTIKNFMSFRDSVIFSLEAGERLRKFNKTNTIVKNKTRLLKDAIVFGANGAGKSNLIMALKTLQTLVLRSTKTVKDELPYHPFAMSKDAENESTVFNLNFYIKDRLYNYVIKYTQSKIIFEKLSYYAKNKEIIYFLRSLNTNNVVIPSSITRDQQTIRQNKTVLYQGQENNDSICVAVYNWFSDSLVFFGENSIQALYSLLDNQQNKETFLKLLQMADFNIIDVDRKPDDFEMPTEILRLFEVVADKDNRVFEPQKINRQKLFTVYKKFDKDNNYIGKTDIPFSQDSKGTQKMIYLVLTMLASQKKDVSLIVDEFDESFHLSLAKGLLRIINSGANSNQFILTTHNINLLDENLRKDQIYFMEKEFTGMTKIYSLFDFNNLKSKPRGDISYFRRYLNGQFGAIPKIDTQKMITLLEQIK